MTNNNNAPFHVGQRVVCVKTSVDGRHIKDEQYTVKAIWQCKCGTWWVGIYVFNETYQIPGCHVCKSLGPSYWLCHTTSFAPISPRHQDVKIVGDLLKEPVPETLDKIKPVLS